ncbi:MAG: hypothetical protein KBS41_06140, partial [Oscillospiraceae bacterium]|nr:hypothetical protein [Candidatus Equicaccousia limihippi]
MYLVQNIKVDIKEDFSNPAAMLKKAAGICGYNVKLKKRSIDARKKGAPVYICSFIFDSDDRDILNNKNVTEYQPFEYVIPTVKSKVRPIIVGFGPSGMFAAYYLAKAGLNPIILEQGKTVVNREKDVDAFFKNRTLNPLSNIQFGEGGAGTFSDGKLNTGIKDRRIEEVLRLFVHFGAHDDILFDYAPHIGTDILKSVVVNMRNEIISLGGEFYFDRKVTAFLTNDNKISGVKCENGEEFLSPFVCLGIGNAARDIFKTLYDMGVTLEQKPFSVGVRIEHLQSDIDKSRYNGNYGLPPASYKMAVHLKNGRGVYTFCMCPGGYVVNSACEKGTVCTNGMSENKRDGKNANSALLVSVMPEDLSSSHPLAGIEFQRSIEKKAFEIFGDYTAPFMTVGEFLGNKNSLQNVDTTVLPGAERYDISSVLPQFVTDALKEALPLFGKKIKGFDSFGAIITAPETRSSSPVKIVRNDNFCSSLDGLYVMGEGAGYAGGITSSAVDGLKCAENVAKIISMS